MGWLPFPCDYPEQRPCSTLRDLLGPQPSQGMKMSKNPCKIREIVRGPPPVTTRAKNLSRLRFQLVRCRHLPMLVRFLAGSLGFRPCVLPLSPVACATRMLTISGMTKAFGARVLFEDASLQVNRGDRIGLVGPNGAGKSTLFSLILGHDTADEGEVAIERNGTLGHLPQETAPVGDETVLELAIAITPEMAELQRRLKAFEAGHDAESHDFHEVQARFDEVGGYQLEPKAKTILHGLAFRERDFNRPLKAMSGGWVMRAHLARLLVQEPDLLLLDEPTNHLDLEALRWFQEYLKMYPGAIVLISHDREFLNQLVGSIVDIR